MGEVNGDVVPRLRLKAGGGEYSGDAVRFSDMGAVSIWVHEPKVGNRWVPLNGDAFWWLGEAGAREQRKRCGWLAEKALTPSLELTDADVDRFVAAWGAGPYGAKVVMDGLRSLGQAPIDLQGQPFTPEVLREHFERIRKWDVAKGTEEQLRELEEAVLRLDQAQAAKAYEAGDEARNEIREAMGAPDVSPPVEPPDPIHTCDVEDWAHPSYHRRSCPVYRDWADRFSGDDVQAMADDIPEPPLAGAVQPSVRWTKCPVFVLHEPGARYEQLVERVDWDELYDYEGVRSFKGEGRVSYLDRPIAWRMARFTVAAYYDGGALMAVFEGVRVTRVDTAARLLTFDYTTRMNGPEWAAKFSRPATETAESGSPPGETGHDKTEPVRFLPPGGVADHGCPTCGADPGEACRGSAAKAYQEVPHQRGAERDLLPIEQSPIPSTSIPAERWEVRGTAGDFGPGSGERQFTPPAGEGWEPFAGNGGGALWRRKVRS